MKCYNHPDTDAVGMCKSCNKGVCSICAKDVSHGLACSKNCATKLNRTNLFTSNNIFAAMSYKTTRGIFLIIGGSFMILSNMLNPYGYAPFSIIGVLFFLMGLYYLYLGSLQKSRK